MSLISGKNITFKVVSSDFNQVSSFFMHLSTWLMLELFFKVMNVLSHYKVCSLTILIYNLNGFCLQFRDYLVEPI